MTSTLREEQGIGVVKRKDLIGDMSSLSSHSAHVSPPHLRPRLSFLTFPSDFPLLQSCPPFSFISSPCPQQLGPFPPGS